MKQEVRTAKEQRDKLPESLHVGYGVARLARLIARNATRRVAEETGLTLAEWRVLLLMGKRSSVHLDSLADRALLEKSHASIAVAALVRKRLVRRSASRTDLRRVSLSRTALGNRVVSQYLAATARERRALWGVLTSREQSALAGFLVRLLEVAERESTETPVRRPYRSRAGR